MPAASAQTARETEGVDAGELSLQIRPIDLVDIGRVLGESAKAERLGDIPIRAWRDDLTVIRDSLSYVRAILGADVAILIECRRRSPDTGALRGSPTDLRLASWRTVAPDPLWPDQDVAGLTIRTSTRASSCARTTCWRPTGRWPGWI